MRDYTPASARALEAAQQWARRAGEAAVLPLHLLLALLAEDEGRAAALLRRVGLDPGSARQALGNPLSAANVQGHTNPLPHSPEYLAVLEHACDAFSIEGDLSTEQLLASLLHLDVGLRGQLECLGLSWVRFQAETKALQGPPLSVEEPLQLDNPVRLSDTTDRMDSARILDACANRAREALRVIEDYTRFVLDDAFLSGELKGLRHHLAEVLGQIDPPHEDFLAAREMLRDVGAALTTESEQTRESLIDVAQANLKRLQESLRSLEEFGKLHSPVVGQAFEKARYRSYTLERAIVLGTTSRQRLAEAKLYILVSGRGCAAALDWTIAEAAAGGANVIQLREKELTDRALLERARQVRHWTRQAGVLFIMNDRPDIARIVEADGVHLGQEELPVKEARRILGPDALIGVSTHSLDQVRQAVLDGASYIGVGPTFPSETKQFADFPGLEFVRQALAETSLPAFVIGGVTLKNVGEAVQAGARRVAVSQALCQADDPRSVARALREALG